MDDQRLSACGIPADLLLAFAEPLLRQWPDSLDLTPAKSGLAGRQREFLRVTVALQDFGWIMYDALLAGSGTEPRILNACVTAKGRAHLIELKGALERDRVGLAMPRAT